MRQISTFITLGLITMLSCENYFNSGTKDPVVAKVGERRLFYSQLEGLVVPGTIASDSAAIVDGFLQNWIRENLMIVEAEKNIAADINLNKLVDDYRSSLLVYNYEKKLVEQQLDTIVLLADKKSYYEANKYLYQLSHPIVKCLIAKVPESVKSLQAIKSALNKSDLTEASFLVKENAVYYNSDIDRWMSVEELKSLIPDGMVQTDQISTGKIFQKRDNKHEFFVKILGHYDEREIPPFEYIDSKITKSILSERKNTLLKQYRTTLYDQGSHNGAYEIFDFQQN
ncbi:MAG: hypothetical protein WAT46_08615 [Saprospiraceae bacterium]